MIEFDDSNRIATVTLPPEGEGWLIRVIDVFDYILMSLFFIGIVCLAIGCVK